MVPRAGARPGFNAGQVAVLDIGRLQRTPTSPSPPRPKTTSIEFLVKRGPAGLSGGALRSALRETGRFEKHSRAGLPGRRSQRSRPGLRGDGDGARAAAFDAAPFVAFARRLRAARRALRRAHGGRLLLRGMRWTTEWREQGVELRQVISQPDGDWSGPTGYVQSLLDNIVPELRTPRRAGLRIERDDGTDPRCGCSIWASRRKRF